MGPRNYIITVSLGMHHAILRCLVYFLDQTRSHRGFEFRQLMTPLPPTTLPTGRQATFTEEMRATGFAPYVSSTDEESDEDVIRQRMIAVFGKEALVNIQKAD